MALQYSPTHTIVWGTLKDIWGWRSQEARARHGRPDGQGGLRNLHEPLRMPGRLPEGYHRGLHRQDEPRIPRRHCDLRRKGVRKGLILKCHPGLVPGSPLAKKGPQRCGLFCV